MAAAHFFVELVVGREVFGEAERLIEPKLALGPFGDGGLVGLDGAVAAGQQGPDVLGRRGRGEGPLEDPQRRRAHAARVRVRRRRVFEPTRQRAWAVERELGGLRGLCRRRCNLVWELMRTFLLLGLDGFAMADSH